MLLEEGQLEVYFVTRSRSPFYDQQADRYLRGEALASLGRHEEALAWFRTLERHGPALLRRAEIRQELGNRERAINLYAQFVELWKDCDPGQRPTVERTQQALNALVGNTL